MALCKDLEETGHIERTREKCSGCQQVRLVGRRTAKDIRDRISSPRKHPAWARVERVLLAANPAVVPGSFSPDPKTGLPMVTARCLYPGCAYTERVLFNQLRKHVWCPKHPPQTVKGAEGGASAESSKVNKIPWGGRVVGIQPRIRLLRSFDEVSHSYLGYVLEIEGTLGDQREIRFQIAIGEGAQGKHAFRPGDEVSGTSSPVEIPALEVAPYYKTSGLVVHSRGPDPPLGGGPPFLTLAPALGEYRARGHRRLDARRYAERCMICVWGCKMPVEIIRDNWNRSRGPDNVIRRMETFCYGPKECPLYRAGPVRKVPGRRGMVHEDEGDSRGRAVPIPESGSARGRPEFIPLADSPEPEKAADDVPPETGDSGP
jgi:hypothetical protein